MDSADILTNWINEHKARSCTIDKDDGYGAACWSVELFGEKGTIFACESDTDGIEEKTLAISSDEDDYVALYVSTAASPKTLYVSCKKKPGDFIGLKRVILAAVALYDTFPAKDSEA